MEEKQRGLSLKERWRQYRQELKGLTMMSDAFMRSVLKEKACTEHILQVIMGRSDLRIINQAIQADYKNLQGRSAILDCVAQDDKGNILNIEIQQDSGEASPKRARYHSGLLDMNILKRGQTFQELPDCYVVFITKRDVLGGGLPLYHVKRTVEETNQDFGDGAYILYVDSSKTDGTELGKLMHDLNCKEASQMHSSILAKRVYELKETEGGIQYMCEVMDRIYSEGEKMGIQIGEERGIQIGKAIGEEQGRVGMQRETSLVLANMGMPVEMIAQAVGTAVPVVQEWICSSKEN